MSTDNRYAMLENNNENTNENNSNDIKNVLENTQKKETTRKESSRVPAHLPVKRLHFETLIYVLKQCVDRSTRNTVYGNAFYDAIPKLRELIDSLNAIYSEYNNERINKCLWNKTFYVFHINGDERPATFTNEGASFTTILRLVCAQIREISEKELILRGLVGNENCSLQAEFDFLCSNVLGEQVKNEKNISEPLVDELFEAFKVAQDAKKTANDEKQAKFEELRVKKQELYEQLLAKKQSNQLNQLNKSNNNKSNRDNRPFQKQKK